MHSFEWAIQEVIADYSGKPYTLGMVDCVRMTARHWYLRTGVLLDLPQDDELSPRCVT